MEQTVVVEEEFAVAEVAAGDADEFAVDFTGVGELPVGTALLKITGMKGAKSSSGNRMVTVEITIIDMPEAPQFVNHKIWETWMLETEAKFRTYDEYEGFTGIKPEKGAFKIVKSEVMGREAWAVLKVKKAAKEGYRDASTISRFVKSPYSA